MASMKKTYFTYAILGHRQIESKGDQENWETNELVKPKQILAESIEDVQMQAIRSLTDEQFNDYGSKNIQVMVKPF